MDTGLDGKCALVTGGSSGIGLAVALELAKEGAHVAICAREPDRLAGAERAVRDVARAEVCAISADIGDPEAARRLVDEVAERFGALHVLVVSGGSPPFGMATTFDVADYQAAVSQVLIPAVGLTRQALPHLRAAGWGRLLYVASETASTPVPPLALSGVTRAALLRFAQGVAADVGKYGITVNVLAPGGVRTPPMERAAQRLVQESGCDLETQLAAMAHHSAIGRLARPDEIASAAVFLASERASYITGVAHLIDGGASVMGADLPHLAAARKGI